MSQARLANFPADPSRGALSQAVWLVLQGDRHIGPLSTLELALAAKNGLLKSSDQIWREGLPRWFVAGEIDGLLPRPVATDLPATAQAKERAPTQSLMSRYFDALPRSAAGAAEAPREREGLAALHARPTTAWASNSAPSSLSAAEPTSLVRNFARLEELSALAALRSRLAPEAAAPVRTEHLPAIVPVGGMLTTGRRAPDTVTGRIAKNIAHQIVILLDTFEIKNLDDATSTDRLRQLTRMAFDAMPATLRFAASTSVGREFVEEKIFHLLRHILATIPPEARAADLRRVVLDHAPWLADRIDEAIDTAVTSVGSAVRSNWNAAVAVFSGAPTELSAPPARLPAPMLALP